MEECETGAADLSPEALAEGEASAKAGCFGGFRRSYHGTHGGEAVGLHIKIRTGVTSTPHGLGTRDHRALAVD